jgi:branched-chain amino acid transport system ATP-binding protein
MQTTPTQSLSAEAISVTFDGLRAISEVTLHLVKGEILGLIGPNGAGKTTLVNCLSGFQSPSSGRVRLTGHDTARWKAAEFRRKGIARTFQGGRLFREMSVLENVEVTGVALGMSRREARRAAFEALTWMGIGRCAHQIAGTLPYTDERRVGIARALLMRPDFLLLDEPAAGMSDHECQELTGLIRSILSELGCGILLIEHNMAVVLGICSRVHVMDGGRTLAEGSPEEVRKQQAVVDAYLGAEA